MKYNIKFPIVDDTSTNDFLLKSSVSKEMYVNSLLLLLLTNKGERYYDPNYGTNLQKFIFQPFDGKTESDVVEDIKRDVKKYIPELTIKTINITIGDNEHQLNVNILFTFDDDTFSEEASIDITF